MAKSREPKTQTPAMPRKIERARFKYVFDDSYNPVYANGAHGGPTPHGELALNFFVERNPVPLSETYAVSEDGRTTDTLAKEPVLPEGTIEVIRYVTTGVIISQETAKRIYEFLGRHLQQLDAINEARKGLDRIGQKAGEVGTVSPRKPRAKP